MYVMTGYSMYYGSKLLAAAAASVLFALSKYVILHCQVSSVNLLRCNIDLCGVVICLLNNFIVFRVLDLGVLWNHDIVRF